MKVKSHFAYVTKISEVSFSDCLPTVNLCQIFSGVEQGQTAESSSTGNTAY